MFGFIKKTVTLPVRYYKSLLKKGIGSGQQAELKSSAGMQIKKISNHFKNVSKDRDPWASDAPNMKDFDQVMDHWGIQRKNLDLIIRNLCIQTLLYSFAGIYGAWWFFNNESFRLFGLPIMILGALALVCKGWRIQILYREKFVFFKDWFLWGLFSWVGKETPIARQKRKERING